MASARHQTQIRKVHLVLISIFLVTGFCFGQPGVSLSPKDGRPKSVHVNWTEFLTEDMRRWNPYENILNVNNVGSLQLRGSYPASSGIEPSPAVVNGVVYVGSGDGNVYAFSLQ